MPMTPEYRAAMNDNEGPDGDFEPLADGFYLCKLEKADETDRPGPSGFTQYVFVWRVQRPRVAAKRTLWDRISLSPKAAFKMRELFDATGYEYESEPEELIGEMAILQIQQEEITGGKRKGQMGESVVAVYAPDSEEHLALVGK